ncbi:MAG: CHAT domain-containing protein [Xenococcus sp. MO_188.B8]|nr:CHAT domain-containing protein [Xenococcus sp. MO_188.B8]
MKKILILEANPQRDLKLNEEIRDLQNVIERSQSERKFEIKISPALRSSDLQEAILRFEPNIIHFCGHGTVKEGLVLIDKKLNTEVLSSLFELFKEHLECVVLNACYSEIQADAINKHIKYVIGMNQAIRDDAAIAFSIGFYRALGYGRSFEDAFKFGKNAIQLAIGDSSKSRNAIAEDMRKLVAIDDASETLITQEHLKPVFKVNSDIILPEPLPSTPIVNEFNQIQIEELQEDMEILKVRYQAIKGQIREGIDAEQITVLKTRLNKIISEINDKKDEIRVLKQDND